MNSKSGSNLAKATNGQLNSSEEESSVDPSK